MKQTACPVLTFCDQLFVFAATAYREAPKSCIALLSDKTRQQAAVEPKQQCWAVKVHMARHSQSSQCCMLTPNGYAERIVLANPPTKVFHLFRRKCICINLRSPACPL